MSCWADTLASQRRVLKISPLLPSLDSYETGDAPKLDGSWHPEMVQGALDPRTDAHYQQQYDAFDRADTGFSVSEWWPWTQDQQAATEVLSMALSLSKTTALITGSKRWGRPHNRPLCYTDRSECMSAGVGEKVCMYLRSCGASRLDGMCTG